MGRGPGLTRTKAVMETQGDVLGPASNLALSVLGHTSAPGPPDPSTEGHLALPLVSGIRILLALECAATAVFSGHVPAAGSGFSAPCCPSPAAPSALAAAGCELRSLSELGSDHCRSVPSLPTVDTQQQGWACMEVQPWWRGKGTGLCPDKTGVALY